jgi:hypothetical protein
MTRPLDPPPSPRPDRLQHPDLWAKQSATASSCAPSMAPRKGARRPADQVPQCLQPAAGGPQCLKCAFNYLFSSLILSCLTHSSRAAVP